jgi:SAM-dependent methyltransferase
MTVTAIVDPSNAETAKAWDGDEGAYWTAHAEHFDRSVAAYQEPFMAAAAIGPSDRVLDIGCGTGLTTREAGRRAPSGSAFGVDLSAEMIGLARRLTTAEGLENVAFEQADAQVHPFGAGQFDTAISRTGAMFFGDREAAFANIARAVRPGGRLVLLTWQPLPRNEWIREFLTALSAGRALPPPPPGAPGPFALSEPDYVRRLLTESGFGDVTIDAVDAPMWFGADAEDAYEFVLGLMGWMLAGADDDVRRRALAGLRQTTAAHEQGDGVLYDSGAWLTVARRASSASSASSAAASA